MISEVFPLHIRGQAAAVAVQLNFLLNALVQLGVPILESALGGLSPIFGLFAGLTAYSLYFIYNYVLETKGISLEEIERKYQQRGGRISSYNYSEEEIVPLQPGA